jgi:drug/metabolite transporter (DMT)-like permease
VPEPFLLFALGAALVHALSSVYAKGLHAHAQSPLKVAFYSLFGCAAVSLAGLPAVDVAGIGRAPLLLLAMACTVAAGHLSFIAALRAGDASFVVPLLGLKVFFVAGLSAWFLGERYGPLVYAGAAGAVTGMFLLGDGRLRAPGRALALVALTTFLFALTDVLLIHIFRAGYGPVEVMVYMFVLPTLLLAPAAAWLLRHDWQVPAAFGRSLARYATLQMGGGVLLMAAFALSHQATMVNIVQSVRGLFAVGLVYLVTRAGALGYERLARRQYLTRTVGAALMTGSVALAVLAR